MGNKAKLIGKLLGVSKTSSYDRYLFEIDSNTGNTDGFQPSALWIHDKVEGVWVWTQVMAVGSFTTRVRYDLPTKEDETVTPIGFPSY